MFLMPYFIKKSSEKYCFPRKKEGLGTTEVYETLWYQTVKSGDLTIKFLKPIRTGATCQVLFAPCF